MPYNDTIFSLREKYSDIPFEAILKSDLLRLGIGFSPEALKITAQAKSKSYFIFSFDRAAQKDLSELERRAVPEEIALIGGPFDLKRTIVSVRVNPKSPYRIVASMTEPGLPGAAGTSCGSADHGSRCRKPEGLWDAGPMKVAAKASAGEGVLAMIRLQLLWRNEPIADLLLPEAPPYYDVPLKNGKPVTDIAPTIEWGYLIYLTAFRLCQYWGREEECQFCDINNNYRQQKSVGRSYTGIKSPEEILEALQIIRDNDPNKTTHAYTVTGGSVTTKLDGLSEAEFYAQYARAIEEKFPGRWIPKAVVQALPREEVKLLKDSGYRIYHPNFEVWDKDLFVKLCPGKEHYVGREEWMRRILTAAEIFGPENVIPNFVAGIEMSHPHGFQTIDEAIISTAEGLDFFMAEGICPRFTVWCVEPNTTLSETNAEPPPLEYFIRLLQVYRDTFFKYKLPIPPGYGEAGLGKAVFSVSAFMDVL